MDDPRLQPLPENFLDRVRTLARDIAYGTIVGEFSGKVTVSYYGSGLTEWNDFYGAADKFNDYIHAKWESGLPEISVLETLGYVHLYEKQQNSTVYILTSKAFDLLEAPLTPPKIFISYKRDESAAFGLLLVARLKMVGIPNPFIDMDIRPGDEWHAHLHKTIQNCDHFISLLAPKTLESEIVKQEITWAREANLQIIPIWHNGFAGYDNLPPELSSKNAIRVKEESAEEYNNAVIRLLNRLGYTP